MKHPNMKIEWSGAGYYVARYQTEEEVIMSRITDGSYTYAQAMALARTRGYTHIVYHAEPPVYMEVVGDLKREAGDDFVANIEADYPELGETEPDS